MAPVGVYVDVYDTCPFDSSHSILRHRMQVHISKCKNQHKDFQMCPYDSLHWTRNLSEHVATCPKKRSMVIERDPNFQSKETCNVTCEEMWEDCNETYNPQNKVGSSNVITSNRTLMTKSQKRAFREEERIRLNQYKK